MFLKFLLFGLIVFFAARGVTRLVRGIFAPMEDEPEKPQQTDSIDPAQIRDAKFRDLEE